MAKCNQLTPVPFKGLRLYGLRRTLGSIACVIAERKNVHHSIISSLDSHDNVELEAAIYAASLFAAKSKYVDIHISVYSYTVPMHLPPAS